MKSLIVCCDGTWNSVRAGGSGREMPTNVAKICDALAAQDDEGRPQLPAHYAPGVGTRRFEHLRGGAFGFGLSRNVQDCYRFVVENYEPGDRLYFFGFSRGAYTARSTVGLIRNCGILRHEHADRVADAYRLYRGRDCATRPTGDKALEFRRMYSQDNVPIHFLGVWDTVGALGIPIDGLPIPKFISKRWTFHDTKLSSSVASAYHALAIDEQRRLFTPALWTRQEHAEGQILEQVWFTGVHCDVGGGYPEPELSEISLLWMVDRARSRGLAFKPTHFVITPSVAAGDPRRERAERVAPDALGCKHDSFTRMYRLLGRRSRELTDDKAQSVASTAVRRLRRDVAYRPASLRRWIDYGGPVTTVEDRLAVATSAGGSAQRRPPPARPQAVGE